ncbi:BolA family protein [Sulfitobacter donghicola]|uniref:BolA family transcriptional regulator n=1 Tax=Sulfitobacter donghicola DSW-25 = KCTC 12864 = JCM 14565 TaxID=1300350 RepID=A0A073IHV9_9RHOB|nr:BolA family protein [Sulfitobacter donghicola]KEJ89374.1 BolA family transcriptional regulator [Sulfitobacter donghicola DSW-25 = KCTC 12864 = JCM 14565]KIN69189.1 BolA family protein [Sulfitobacter donghicola DSW-25 = KCTC 12864 = JCM 14565]
MAIKEEIEKALETAFAIERLTVEDVSEAHRGHAGFREGGETHFDVSIRAPDFAGLSRLAKHRAVHSALGADLISRIHALALDINP